MTASQLVAQAVASWLASRLSNEADLVREALPPLDVDWLFKALKVEPAFDPGAHSLALAGFGLSEVDIQEKATTAGLAAFRGLCDDLHVAASWRNDRTNHSSIIALARGWHPGVSTLSHFGVAHSRDLAVQLLAWAETKSGLAVNERQKELLQGLQQPQAAELVSLDSVSAFLAAWFSAKVSDALDAPRVALSRLGLLADPALFEKPGTVGERLIKNFATVQRIKDAPAANLRTVQRNLIKRFVRDLATRDRLLRVCDQLRQIRLSPSPDNLAEVTITDVLEVWKPPKDAKPEPLPDPFAPEDLPDLPEEPDDTGTQDLRKIAVTTGEDLLDNKQDRLTARLEGLESALQLALAENQKAVDAEIEVDGDTVAIEFPIDQDLLGWLNTYCAMDAWGGLLHTT